MTATYASLLALDRDLVAAGHHPLTPWWRAELKRFYEHPTARTLVARVGRGGAKSHTAAKVSLNEVIHGDFVIPPGEVHFWAYVSTTKDEAAQRLRLIERFLIDLDLSNERTGDQIILTDESRGWRVMAADIGATSGFRGIGYSVDEAAKIAFDEKAVSPCGEIVTSLNAVCVTHRNTRSLLISSPMGKIDYHADRMKLGDTAEQLTATAASWVANEEGISEAECRAKEGDPRKFAREFGAIPQDAVLAAFDAEAIESSIGLVPVATKPYGLVGVIDASGAKGRDAWTFGVCGWYPDPLPSRGRKVAFPLVDGFFDKPFWKQRSSDEIVATVATEFHRLGVRTVFGDQYSAHPLKSDFRRNGLELREIPWVQGRKERAMTTLRGWFRDRQIILPAHERLQKELLSFEEKVTSNGGFTWSARGSGHDDLVSLLLMAAAANDEGGLPGSPSRANAMAEAIRFRAERDAAYAKLGLRPYGY